MRLCRLCMENYICLQKPTTNFLFFLINHNISSKFRYEFKCQRITFFLPSFLLVQSHENTSFLLVNTHENTSFLLVRSPILDVPNQFPSDSPRSRAVSVLFSSICLQRGTLPVVSNILRVLADLQNPTKNWA